MKLSIDTEDHALIIEYHRMHSRADIHALLDTVFLLAEALWPEGGSNSPAKTDQPITLDDIAAELAKHGTHSNPPAPIATGQSCTKEPDLSAPDEDTLTDRHRAVLRRTRLGQSRGDIAEALGIKVGDVANSLYFLRKRGVNLDCVDSRLEGAQ